ncbi:MAG: hypothetical protein WC224_06605 [Sphaerochaetaceae bacterium]
MAKAHRGAGIREQLFQGRGTCPVCKRTGVKVLYEHEIDGNKAMLCKQCSASIKKAK